MQSLSVQGKDDQQGLKVCSQLGRTEMKACDWASQERAGKL